MLKNKFTFLLFFICLASISNAQQIYLESGFENAYFKDYVNNLGANTLDNSYAKSQQLFIEGGVRIDLDRSWERGWNTSNSRLKADIGFSYNNYKINTGFYGGNVSIPLTYELAYIALKTGINFVLINKLEFKLLAHGHLSYDILVSGSSKYNNVVNNIYKDKTLDRTLFRYHRGVTAEYVISEVTSIYLKYNVADSFKEKNSDSNIEEEYSLHTHAFSVGLLFNIEQIRF